MSEHVETLDAGLRWIWFARWLTQPGGEDELPHDAAVGMDLPAAESVGWGSVTSGGTR